MDLQPTLGIRLRAQCSRFKQRLLIENTLSIDVETSFDIVQCINHKVLNTKLQKKLLAAALIYELIT